MAKKAKFNKNQKAPKWMVENLGAKPEETVEWDGTAFNSEFVVWFPSNRNPLVGSNELFSNRGMAQGQVKAAGGSIQVGASFPYCILLTDGGNKDVVVGQNSPPEMIIE